MKTKNKIWGKNKGGQIIEEHDKLLCGNGYDKWFTHVQFDTENNCWHRESDYINGQIVDKY